MESMLAEMPQLRIALLCAAPLLYLLAAAGLAPGAWLLSLVWLAVGGGEPAIA